jgi:hypothetical protein
MCFEGANLWVISDTSNNTITKINANTGITVGTYPVDASVWANRLANTLAKF